MHVIVTISNFAKRRRRYLRKLVKMVLHRAKKKPFSQGGEMRRRLFIAAHRFLWTLQPPRRSTNEGWIKCIEK